MDLIDEDDRALPAVPGRLRLLHDLADLFDAAGHRAEIDECRRGLMRDDPRQRRLSHARRTPENHRGHQVIFDQLPQDPPLREQMPLSDILIQRQRPHPVGERFLQ